MIGPLNSQLNAIKWGEFRLGDLFEIEKTLSFNKDALTQGQDYDYITRTSQNQGVLQTTGFVNAENLNPPFTWSLGLLQMDFFYRKKSWYAGQFMRKITPKTEIENKIDLRIAHYFTTLLNALKRPLLSVLVRDIDKTFREQKIQLPLKPTANTQTLDGIDFHFMEKFIAELEQCRLAELQAYLKATGLENTTLSNDEENALNVFKCGLTWQSFRLGDLFEIYTGRDIIIGQTQQGDIPLVSHQHENNGITKTIKEIHNRTIFNHKQTIALADRGVFLATTQNKDFHIGTRVKALVFKNGEQDKKTRLFFTTCINKNQIMFLDYSSNATNKLPNLTISLPTNPHGKIDFHFMRTFINALMKQTIQGVAQYCDAKIQAAKEIISQETPIQKDSLF
ncbi:restriction endonuclease subunit S [Helicobacter pylori]|uniref:restriction endonuclease subunit S n=1 Tax=Helicobacter pylori TaxID=210 RepID=UPI0034660A2A